MDQQYLGSIGKIDHGVGSVSSLWADELRYWVGVRKTVNPGQTKQSEPALRELLEIPQSSEALLAWTRLLPSVQTWTVWQGDIPAEVTSSCPKRRRCRCTQCGKTFSERTGTPFQHVKTAPEIITQVLTLIAYGCPIVAIEAAFEVQRRAVRD